MSVNDGQPVDAAVSNPSWISKNTDDNTPSRLGVGSVQVNAGNSITASSGGIQRVLNALSSFAGVALSAAWNVLPSWPTSNRGASSDTLFLRAAALDTAFDATTGHKHTGGAGDAPEIAAINIANVPLAGYGVQGTDFTALAGSSSDVTGLLFGSTPSNSPTVEGVVVNTPYNKNLVQNPATNQDYTDGSGNTVYGRLTFSAGTWTLSYFVLIAGVETVYSFPGSTPIRWYYQVLASPLDGTSPTYSPIFFVPSGNATADVVDASPTQRGLVNTTTQSFAGNKTFTGTIGAANLSGTNTGDATLAAVGATPNADGASLAGQVLTLQPADDTNPGVLTALAQAIGGLKTFFAGIIGKAFLALQRNDVASAGTPFTAFDTSKTFAKLTGTTAATVQGALAGVDGQILTIHNGTNQPATIKHQDAGASASGRFNLPGANDIVVTASSSAEFQYDTGQSRWVVKSGSGSGLPYVTGKEWFVDITNGAATGNTGAADNPFKSLTAALAVATLGDVVILAPGNYSGASPYTVPRGVSIVGIANAGRTGTANHLTRVGVLNFTDTTTNGANPQMVFKNIRADFSFNVSASSDLFNFDFENLVVDHINLTGNAAVFSTARFNNVVSIATGSAGIHLVDVPSVNLSSMTLFNGGPSFQLLGNCGAYLTASTILGTVTLNDSGGNSPLLTTDRGSLASINTLNQFGNSAVTFTDEVVVASAGSVNLTKQTVIPNDASGGADVINLPKALNYTGDIVYFSKSDASGNPVVITPFAGDTVNLAATLSLTKQGQSVGMISDKVNNWILVSSVGLDSGGGSGGGAFNYVGLNSAWQRTKPDNSNAESSVGDWAAYLDSTPGPLPTSGMTGGSPTTTITRTTTAGQVLNGAGSFLFTKPGSNVQGEGASVLVNVPLEFRLGRQLFALGWKLLSGSLVQGDVILAVWDVTNNVLLNAENNDLIGGSGFGAAYFQLSPTTAQIRIGLHIASTTTSAIVLSFDDVQAGPSFGVFDSAVGPARTDRVFTPEPSFGIITNSFWETVQVGNKLHVRGYFKCGTNTSSAARFALPAGLQIDTDLIGAGNTNWVGDCVYANATSSALPSIHELFVTPGDTGNVYVGFNDDGANGIGATNADTLFPNNVGIFLKFSIPILGWNQKVQLASTSQFRIADILATGTRVVGTPPTQLGQYRSYLRNAGASTYTETNGTPSTLPTIADGIALWCQPTFASADANNEPSFYEIFVGKNKSVSPLFFQVAGRTGVLYTNGTRQDVGGTESGTNWHYDPTSGIASVQVPEVNGINNYIGQNSTDNVFVTAFFDLIVSENALGVGLDLKIPTIQKFLSGSGTYTPNPARQPLYLKVRMAGAGGGGSGGGVSGMTNGTSGGTTTFGTSLLTATGGQGGGLGSLGGTATINAPADGLALSGGSGSGSAYEPASSATTMCGGTGGTNALGGGGGGQSGPGLPAAPNTGAGGAGGGAVNAVGSQGGLAGGAGGYIEAIVPVGVYPYAVGAHGVGGSAGSSGAAATDGADGMIEVTEYYQ